MNDPLNDLFSRYPERTLLLGQAFNNTAASYKFFWSLGLLTLLQGNSKGVFTQREIVEKMIVGAWHPVCFYRLSLGTQDKLQEVVKELQSGSVLKNDAKPDEIHDHIKMVERINGRLQALSNLVPTRFLSPWFTGDLHGLSDYLKTKRIRELALRSQKSTAPSPYFFENVGSDTLIRVNESWAIFFQENFEVIRSFIFFHLCRYLQARNPNVPGIVNKLNAPVARDLGPARKFWKAVRVEFDRRGKGSLFHDIYTGDPLNDSFSIDHFLPWSFVAHDLLWNLTPVAKTTNSAKGDSLPKLDVYLPRLSKLHREALLVMGSRPKMLEDYANWFMADIGGITSMTEDQFFLQYQKRIDPQLQIANNQGFRADWCLS